MSAKSMFHASRWVSSVLWLAVTTSACIGLAGDPAPDLGTPAISPLPAAGAASDAKEESTADEKDVPRQLIVVRVSADVFRPLIEKPFDEVGPVDEVILGTRCIGQGRLTGQPTLELIEDPDRAGFRVVFRGKTVSRTTGQNGPAIIHSRSETVFAASKRVEFEPGKGFYSTPAKINARTRTFTEDIETTRGRLVGRMVERRAWEAVNGNRPTVNEIARELASKRICEAFDKKLDQRLEELNSTAKYQRLVTLLRGSSEPMFRCCSSPDYLQFALAREKDCPWPELPNIPEKAAPVQVYVHKSLLDPDLLATLRRANRVKNTITDLVASALITVPTSTEGEPQQEEPAEPAVDYFIVDDWAVIRLGIEPGQDSKTMEAKASKEPTLRR